MLELPPLKAGVAQLAEHLLPKQRVEGSSPFARSKLYSLLICKEK